MSQDDLIGAGVLIAIMGPPEIKNILNILLNVIFMQTVQRE